MTASSVEPSKDKHVDLSADSSEDPIDGQCIICLQPIVDRTVLACSHDAFCYDCMLIWTRQSRKCPLCAQSMGTYLIHEIRDKFDYTKYYLPPLPSSTSPVPARNRPLPSTYRSRTHRRPIQWGGASSTREDALSARDALDRAIDRRKWIYRHGLYAKHMASNKFTRYRPVPTPSQIAASEELMSKATAFIRRELRVWVNLDVEFLTTFVVSLLKTMDIRSEKAVQSLAEFLDLGGKPYTAGAKVSNAEHFVHELYAFLRSPYREVTVYDMYAQYNVPDPLPATPDTNPATINRWRPRSPVTANPPPRSRSRDDPSASNSSPRHLNSRSPSPRDGSHSRSHSPDWIYTSEFHLRGRRDDERDHAPSHHADSRRLGKHPRHRSRSRSRSQASPHKTARRDSRSRSEARGRSLSTGNKEPGTSRHPPSRYSNDRGRRLSRTSHSNSHSRSSSRNLRPASHSSERLGLTDKISRAPPSNPINRSLYQPPQPRLPSQPRSPHSDHTRRQPKVSLSADTTESKPPQLSFLNAAKRLRINGATASATSANISSHTSSSMDTRPPSPPSAQNGLLGRITASNSNSIVVTPHTRADPSTSATPLTASTSSLFSPALSAVNADTPLKPKRPLRKLDLKQQIQERLAREKNVQIQRKVGSITTETETETRASDALSSSSSELRLKRESLLARLEAERTMSSNVNGDDGHGTDDGGGRSRAEVEEEPHPKKDRGAGGAGGASAQGSVPEARKALLGARLAAARAELNAANGSGTGAA